MDTAAPAQNLFERAVDATDVGKEAPQAAAVAITSAACTRFRSALEGRSEQIPKNYLELIRQRTLWSESVPGRRVGRLRALSV